MRKELELIKLMNERGQICTETIEKSKDSLLQILARRELEIITEYTRILDALEKNNQRKEEAESRVKTNGAAENKYDFILKSSRAAD